MLAKSVSYFLIVMLSLVEVYSQVCLKQATFTKKVMRTYSKNNLEYYGYPTKLRIRTSIIERWETLTEVEDIKVCCDGYKKKYYNIEVREQNCEPICKSNCTNGYCKHPNVCACNAGYTKLNDACEPLCEEGCLHGVCVAPSTCRCDSGYNLVNGTCLPICTEPCGNGTCTAPDTCECNHGYYKRMYSFPYTTSCEPYCPIRCPLHGHCAAPARCECNSGWRLSETNSFRCVAVCRYPCGNGTCLYPNSCLCDPGFQIDYYIQSGITGGQVCEQIYQNGSTQIFHRSNETSTTTTRDPLETKSTQDYYEDYDENVSTTTTVSYSVSSSSFTDMVDDVNTSVTVEYNDTVTGTLSEKSWMQQHGMFIWIPLMIIVTAGLMLLLFLTRIPMTIINFFKRRSYNVQGAFLKRNGSGSYESLHFITDARETQT